MKNFNLLFKLILFSLLFMITPSSLSAACSDYTTPSDKTGCEADDTCKWTGSPTNGACDTVSTGGGTKLELYKNASPQYIDENRTITYILTLINGTNSDGNFTLHDDMPDGLFEDSHYGISDSGNFTCDINTSRSEELLCTGILPVDSVAHIIYTVTAPDTGMQITNTVSVTEDDSSTILLTASVTVTVLPNYNGDLDYNRDICYIPTTEEPNSCDYSNQFSYGKPCQSEIQLFHVSDRNLLNVHVFKSYSSEITSDSCYTLSDNVDCNQTVSLEDVLNRESSLFFKDAFDGVLDYSLGNFIPDQNETIIDVNTESSNASDFQYVALIAQYNVQDSNDTVEEYVYSCFATNGGGILQDSSGGVNDVNLQNNTFTAEDSSVALAISYDSYDKVGTKIVNQPFLLNITYLDANKNPADFNGYITDESDQSKEVSAAIVLQWKAYGVEHALWSGELAPDDDDLPDTLITYKKYTNDGNTVQEYPVIDEAFQNGQILVKLVDYPSFLGNLDTNSPCVSNSAFNGNLCNVPQCFNSPQQIFNVFPIENYPLVATCVYGDGGGAAPCDSNAYTGRCQGNKLTISPEKYNDYDGCAQCLADAVATVESSNTFSVRPYSYELSTTEWQNGLNQAAVDYLIDLNATTADGNISQSPRYNTTLEGDNPPTVIATIGLDTSKGLPCAYDTNESQLIQFSDGNSQGPISYSNVGETILTVMDQNWTRVDWNVVSPGTPECILDSNETDPTLDPLNLGRVGCMVIAQAPLTFVPFTFDIDANLTNHNTAANFTYLNDFNATDGNTNMAASLDVNISAVNADGNVTTNYTDGCYAKDNNLTLTFTPYTINPAGSLTHMLYYNVADNNISDIALPAGSITSLPEPLQSSSASFKPTDLGNSTFQYKLNFNRKTNLFVSAFALDLTDANITDVDNVVGNQIGIIGQRAVMHYAKARPAVGLEQTFDNIYEEIAVTPIMIHVYCDPTFGVMCNSLSLSSPVALNWWLATGHDTNIGDGNITLEETVLPDDIELGSGTPDVPDIDITIATSGIDTNVTVERGANPTFNLLVHVNIDANKTDSWLLYKLSPFHGTMPDPFYKVNFKAPTIWVGPGGTGSVVDTNVNTNTNMRSNW